MKKIFTPGLIVTLALWFGFTVEIYYTHKMQPITKIETPISQSVNVNPFPNFEALYKNQDPSVVAVTTTFPDVLPIEPSNLPTKKMRGIGSGFFISSDGYIVTNAHVIGSEKSNILITTYDNKEFPATIIGFDKMSDIALLKIKAGPWQPIEIGDPSKLQIGEWVAAIGKPYGLENTFTTGIISAMNRTLPTNVLTPFLQTTTPVNPGNSGGPLFNMDGQVVGINAEILSPNGNGFIGLAFSIPIDYALNIVNKIKNNEPIIYGRIGVNVGKITDELVVKYHLPNNNSVVVKSTEENGPGQLAGLRKDDIILSVDHRPLVHEYDLVKDVLETTPGTSLSIQVLRDGHLKNIVVVPTKLDPNTIVDE